MKRTYCSECGAKLDKQISENRERDYCSSCSTVFYSNPVPATAGVIIDSGKVLLVKRGVEPQKGKWCLPGGFLEIDEEPEKGCLREVKEETHLECEIDHLLKVCLSPNPTYKNVLLTGFVLKNFKGKAEAGDDSVDCGWFSPDALPEIAFESHLKMIRKAFSEAGRRKITEDEFGAYVITSEDHCRLAEEACKGGAKVVQYRDKKSSRKELLANSHKIREITARYGALFIVNDYIDIALITGADGVHLGQDDIPVREAASMVPEGFIIGISTHSIEQAVKAEKEGADYIGIGPVFKTPTKKDYINIGVETVKAVSEKIKIPFVAIGGLNMETIKELNGIEIRNVAMVREFQENTSGVIKELNDKLKKGEF